MRARAPPSALLLRKCEESVIPADVEESDACTGVEPAMGVVGVREGLLEFALTAEVLRIVVVRASHCEKILGDLSEVGLLRRGDGDLCEGALCQRDVFVDEGGKVHRTRISAAGILLPVA